ncbi:Nitroreductase [Aspergillus japonicus CBS 114.51]|uniref:Nitroreductase n=2 Tax=Aspergillus TaxID=5052 RepID=A0A2V5GR31_ASPV1|nr:Nitroreductase [Aspergillus japonicus CBS 114.51]PYI13605.1 Nitroreductase [Aspergillus violaceofuscus CBS 115571]RAH83791.1 Nitroreductase [Aspergillus japonicus CBS 114.51]
MSGSSTLLAALAGRRSYYALRRESPIPDAKIQSILNQIVLQTPSAFNSQTTRILVLLKQEHDKLWDIVKDSLLTRIGAERYQKTAPKIDGFRAAYGTVLFYEDQTVVADHKAKFASYAEHFEAWSEQTSGMHQLMAWTALETEGFGANLQHYNPLIDDKVASTFEVPAQWKLRAQLVFGVPEGGPPPPKEKKPLEELIRVLGNDSN